MVTNRMAGTLTREKVHQPLIWLFPRYHLPPEKITWGRGEHHELTSYQDASSCFSYIVYRPRESKEK